MNIDIIIYLLKTIAVIVFTAFFACRFIIWYGKYQQHKFTAKRMKLREDWAAEYRKRGIDPENPSAVKPGERDSSGWLRLQ